MADSTRIEELTRRVRMDPASIAFAALAEEYRRAGRFEESVATCRAGLQRHPAYISARVTLGRSLVELGQLDEAADLLEHVLKVAPENLAAIRALADIHRRRMEDAEQPVAADPPVAPPVPQAAARVAISVGPPPKDTRSVDALEAFLGAIGRARQSLDSAPKS